MVFKDYNYYRVVPIQEINRLNRTRRDGFSCGTKSSKLDNNVDNHKPFSECLKEIQLVKKK